MGDKQDRRVWSDTDRPGESVAVARPLAGVEVMSVRGSHRHWREAHDSFTLGVIHRAQKPVIAEWRTRGKTLSSERGQVMAIEAGETHITQRLKMQAGSAAFDVVRFSPSLLARAARGLEAPSRFHFASSCIVDPITYDALQGFVIAVATGTELDIECASAHALTALVSRAAERGNAAALDPIRDYRLRRVREYLRGHLDKRPTLTELEAVSGLSRYRLCFVFKRSYGLSVGQYWNALRLADATQRLQRGAPIKMIVSELGFADEPYFSRVFKAHHGLAPRAWSNAFRANDRLSRALGPRATRRCGE